MIECKESTDAYTPGAKKRARQGRKGELPERPRADFILCHWRLNLPYPDLL
jgi:hypothetical protein